ncbi:Rrp15p-domain-containing protein, partial [Peziza echinospora]
DSDDGLDDLLISQYENTSGASASLKRKRSTDPTVFSTTLQKLLGSHLTTKARVDPILVRSKARAEIITDTKLEAKAKRVLSLQKKAELEKGRVRDVIGVVSAGGSASREGSGQDARRTMEKERMLRKIAQRGVVRLFNAVRAAQIKGEEAQKEVKGSVIGMKNREEKVVEMSKKGFLDLIQS